MHDLLHDLAKYVGEGLYFRCELDQTEKIQKVTRHFSIELGHKLHFDAEFGTLCNTKRLRTFMPKAWVLGYYRRWGIKMSIHELFSKFKFLRILSLSHCSDLQELPDSVANLEHLRSLDLSCTGIRRLNEKICLLSHLQILMLNYCSYLKELPSNLYLLTNLCRLELKGTEVRKMPPYLGKVKNLKVVMSSFKVDHGREFGVQQLGQLNLEGSLLIENLQNISNSLDALGADLKNKTHLVLLTLDWGLPWDWNSIDSKKEEEVIKNLQPSKNLKELSIVRYGGKRFPIWLLENSLWNITSLALKACKSCERLPPLGLLPFLKALEITELDGIVSIDADIHGNNSSSFKSLETLEFAFLSRWKKWDCQTVRGAFPSLQKFSITFCPELKGQLQEQLNPLETLKIIHCPQLETSAPRALAVELFECAKLQLEWGTMKRLRVGSSYDDWVSLRSFPLDLCPTLRMLQLFKIGNLEMISQSLIHNHLEELTLDSCPKFESLPGSMHMLLPSLRKLSISECPALKTLPDRGLPSNLEMLTIKGCERLESFPHRGFPSNLQILKIQGWLVFELFRDEGLSSNLRTLEIKDCPRLKSLPDRGFPSSLQTLIIEGCLVLKSFPDEGLSSNLQILRIKDCPRLKSFPGGGFPSNMKDLTIINCSRLVGSLKGAFTDSSSLKRLWIAKLDAKCFPDEGLLPLSLTSLTISDSPKLEKLDYKGLHQLSSLQNLVLENCPNLQRLPEDGLPKSISNLNIRGCPLLEPRCQEEGGEDWEKIAHIQKRYIW